MNGEERSLHIVNFRIQIQCIISLLVFLLELVSWLRNENTLCQQLSNRAKKKKKMEKKKKISGVGDLNEKEKKLSN